MQHSVALVADVGDDDAILPLLTDAGIACGFHPGGPRAMDRAVARCLELGVSVSARPGLPDGSGHGPRPAGPTADEVRTDTLVQIGALQAIATSRGGQVSSIDPHGRLADLLVEDEALAGGVADAVASLDFDLVVVTQEGALARMARDRMLRVALVFVADRPRSGGRRSARASGDGDPDTIAARAVGAVVGGVDAAVPGGGPVAAHLVRLHGDGPAGLAAARRVRAELERAGVVLERVDRVLDHEV